MKIGSTEIPDDCGDFCKIMVDMGSKFPTQYQGDVCYRCPIFCCSGEEPLIEPEGYNPDGLEYYINFLWKSHVTNTRTIQN